MLELTAAAKNAIVTRYVELESEACLTRVTLRAAIIDRNAGTDSAEFAAYMEANKRFTGFIDAYSAIDVHVIAMTYPNGYAAGRRVY